MQLILTQSDIETALINYVNDLVNIKDGMSITVDLKATRGADGATAIIDISPVKAAAKAEPVVKPQVLTNTPTKPAASRTVEVKASEVTKDTEAQPETKAEPEADPSPAAEEQASEPDTSAGEDVAAEANAAEESAQVADEAAEAKAPAAETQAKPKSLFEGLRKPKND